MLASVKRECECVQFWALPETPQEQSAVVDVLKHTPCEKCASADRWTIENTLGEIEIGVYAAYRLLRCLDGNGPVIRSEEINKWAMADAVTAVHFGVKTIHEAAKDLHDEYMWAFQDAENAENTEDAKTV